MSQCFGSQGILLVRKLPPAVAVVFEAAVPVAAGVAGSAAVAGGGIGRNRVVQVDGVAAGTPAVAAKTTSIV